MTQFNVSSTMKEIMAAYYLEAKNASYNNTPVAWITSGAPVEFLYSMGVIPVYPENYAPMCAITRVSKDLIEVSEAAGYSMDVCSYARTNIGVDMTQGGPIMGLPKPDMLIVGTNICHTVVNWFAIHARKYNVPMYMIDMPFLHDGMTQDAKDYVVKQFYGLQDFLSRTLKKPFDKDKFRETLILAGETSALWKKILEIGKKKPSPINSFDTFIHLAPIVTLRGTQRAVDYYRQFYDELVDRSNKGIGSIQHERIRLLWDNLPIWYKMKYLSEMLGNRGAALVVSTYTNSWAAIEGDIDINLDEAKAYDELARAYLSPYINRDFNYRIEYLVNLINEFSLDGIVFHSDRSCKPYSIGQYLIKEEITKRTGKPCLIIEADMNDPRMFSDAQVETRVEAFLEGFEK
ncbi:MAG: 2-hydroxyacyl-CoA dehydratase family protein [Deltaproteobacteria bacterium]|nr:2-hydroxyacyl-CoA dehydratase family protein [Deltaproteobacteria bacterium]MCL5791660.1 2-hydroxyacyl-CoA dehydratase family protein [Deltaproteobacteria bacterium]